MPIRHGRMLVSPFTYFRGAALPMAADLARTRLRLDVQLCGDAHLSNFGIFGSPERHLSFDVNDFDETAPGPWEWDVKRLAASLEVAGARTASPRSSGGAIVRARSRVLPGDDARPRRDVDARRLVRAPRHGRAAARASRRCSTRKRTPSVWHAITKARAHDSHPGLRELAYMVDGEPRIVTIRR